MRRYTAITLPGIACLLFCVPLAQGRNYAVLISAEEATADDAPYNSAFWYDMLLQYNTLLDEGYSHDDIYVLYGYGSNFNSGDPCYQVPYTVPDYPVDRANIQSVFSTLGSLMAQDDFLYVWWMGHAYRRPQDEQKCGLLHLVMRITTTGEDVWDYEFANWVGQIGHYDRRSFSWMTCFSGGILDDLEGPRSIVMSSATFYEETYDEWQCDSFHAEFHYPETCAWHWETPCGRCGPVNDADGDGNGRVSFAEAFIYARNHTLNSHPQISDEGGLAFDTYLGGPRTFRVVPDGSGDCATIQDAIDAARHGDTIELGEGIFTGPGNRNIDFTGKTITIRSENGDASTCVIDCEALGRGFYFHSGEQEDSVIESISIVNGVAPDVPGDNSGGAIHCIRGVSPTVVGCVISGNYADNHGGGVFVDSASLTLFHSTITGNGAGESGGGIYQYAGSVVADNSIIWGNGSNQHDPDNWFCTHAGRIHRCCCDFGAYWERDTVCQIDSCPSGEDPFDADPLFCDPAHWTNAPTNAGDYHLRAGSPCTPRNQPECGLIGALGPGFQFYAEPVDTETLP